MIQRLQRYRANKGFTIVELIVVIAIIAVLLAVIIPPLSVRNSRKSEANSAARDFYAAVQSAMTKYSMYEGALSPQYSANPKLGDMYYYEKLGGNYPYQKGTEPGDIPYTASMYIEFATKNGAITEVYTYVAAGTDAGYANGQGLYELCKRPADCKDTEFGKLLKEAIEGRISYQDGFYYAKVNYKQVLTGTIPAKMEAETVKVQYTAYSRTRLPKATEAFTAFQNQNMYFGDDYVLNSGEVLGVFTSVNATTKSLMGLAGTTLD